MSQITDSISFILILILSLIGALLPWILLGFCVAAIFKYGPRWLAQYKDYAEREYRDERTAQTPTNAQNSTSTDAQVVENKGKI